MKKIIGFVKKETVLTISWILAIVSMIFVPPNIKYIDYIDLRTLGILWSLMIIMQGLQKKKMFDKAGKQLISKTKKVWQLVLVLVLMCFFFSMIITNDVALITFVPFAIFAISECERKDLLVPVITLQTLAANLGSMLTPLGNPQNLYLFGMSDMNIVEFIKIMLPYSLVSFILLIISIFLIKNGNTKIQRPKGEVVIKDKKSIIVYVGLFIFALLTVGGVIKYYMLVAIVLITVIIIDAGTIFEIDYALLFTFTGFFIFTGNIGNIQVIRDFLINIVDGREIVGGILASQIISNVPAALLLSPFTNNLKNLLVGVNLGGLGTLIASMASLISFKLLAHRYNELKGKYFLHFTLMNVIYLIVLLGLALI